MKKLFILSIMLALTLIGFGQATSVADLRIPDATTAFGANQPVGTKIYCVSTRVWYSVKAACVGTLNVTTALSGDKIEVLVTPTDLTVGTVTNTAVPIISSTGTDITTLPLADATHAGIISGTVQAKINAIGEGATVVGITSTDSNTLTVQGTAANPTLTAVTGSIATGATNLVTGGTVASALSNYATTASTETMQSEIFEIPLSGGGANKTVTTAHPIKAATGITVMVNTRALTPTTEYTVVLTTGVITIIPTIYEYDQVVVQYPKSN